MIAKNFIGREYESPKYGKYIIIDHNEYNDNFIIRFINTGYITEASYGTIRHRRVKDNMAPIVAGVGFVGSDINVTNSEYFEYYKVWDDMLNRCYNIFDSGYLNYGEIGVKVDPSWFNFTTFYHDCQLLHNFERKVMYPNRYQLDKDFLQLEIPKEERIYSKYTCIWISDIDNMMIMNRENMGSIKYYGVQYINHAYCTRINNKVFGRFISPEPAAYLYNILYPKYGPQDPFHNIIILNKVKSYTYDELLKYIKPGAEQCWFNDYPR